MATTGTAPPGRTPGGWLDEGEVNPGWAPPAGVAVRGSRLRGPLSYAGVVLALALVVGLLHLTGGFGRRTDLLEPVPAGETVTTGLFELSFTEATAQPQQNATGEVTRWEVVAVGRARTTGEEAMAPTVYDSDAIFALRDPATAEVFGPDGAEIGDDPEVLGGDTRRFLVPGLPATGYQVSFELPVGYRPGPTVVLGVAKLAYGSKYLVSDEQASDDTAYAFRIELPLRELPPKT